MTIKAIDALTLKSWMDADKAVLVDVREPAEYKAAHIKNATLIPLGTVSVDKLPEHANRKLVIHCLKGGRGGNACGKLVEALPHMDIYNLEGGITAWINAGLPVEKTGRDILPLDRQVQLTVGSCVLIGSLLAYFINPLFILIPAFFGAGLVFAGLSGFCGLARLLAVMPWNK